MLKLLDGTKLEILLGEWVMEQVLFQLKIWINLGIHHTVSINVSPNHLMMSDFCESCMRVFSDFPEKCKDYIEFEVLESTSIDDIDEVGAVLKKVSGYGVKIGLDDFGTGYSSLTHVRKLPIDYLKIDTSFVVDMFNDPSDMSMVKSIIHLAHSMDRQVIAEGAETQRHLRVLRELGCDMAQGYAISKAIPADSVLEWLQSYQSKMLVKK